MGPWACQAHEALVLYCTVLDGERPWCLLIALMKFLLLHLQKRNQLSVTAETSLQVDILFIGRSTRSFREYLEDIFINVSFLD